MELIQRTYSEGSIIWKYIDMDPVSEWLPDPEEFGYDFLENEAGYVATCRTKVNDSRGERIEQVFVVKGKPDKEGFEACLREACQEVEGVTFIALEAAA